MKKVLLMLCANLALISCSDELGKQEPTTLLESKSGGEASLSGTTLSDFLAHSANMTASNRIDHFNEGDKFFTTPWQVAGQLPNDQNGLGPLFNNRSCLNCHVKGGRGHAPSLDNLGFETLLFKTSKTQITDEQRLAMEMGELHSVPDTNLGPQLQQQSLAGLQAEVKLDVTYVVFVEKFEDGFEVPMRQPIWHFDETSSDRLINDDIVFSARVAPPMMGLGLLQLIPDSEIIANSDANDQNQDGITGRTNIVWSHINQSTAIGRFGWKASIANLTEQAAAAFSQDMGLTSRLQPQESCTDQQADCLASESGAGDSANDQDFEVANDILEAVAFHSHHVAVPSRLNAGEDAVQNGKRLFEQIGCVSCHRASYVTENNPEHPELSNQTIFPYTDLLLHDMGPDLADFSRHNGPAPVDALTDFSATSHEWRTPPLWGVGRAKQVNPDANFLHDGRARTIMEAVLWHGGEAENAKQSVLKLNANQREDLMAFLNDL
jgi:CxxC motif-containing protein (DUF1111 family)